MSTADLAQWLGARFVFSHLFITLARDAMASGGGAGALRLVAPRAGEWAGAASSQRQTGKGQAERPTAVRRALPAAETIMTAMAVC